MATSILGSADLAARAATGHSTNRPLIDARERSFERELQKGRGLLLALRYRFVSGPSEVPQFDGFAALDPRPAGASGLRQSEEAVLRLRSLRIGKFHAVPAPQFIPSLATGRLDENAHIASAAAAKKSPRLSE